MDLGLSDKVAVVLASSDGLGFGAAAALVREGARVALSGRDPARLEAARARLPQVGADRVLARALDVTDLRALRAHLDEVRERWGTVHVLVTNSGGPPPGRAQDLDQEALAHALPLTLGFAVEAIRHVLPWMRAQRWGRIVALTSMAVREPIGGLALSNALRAGLTGYLKTLSDEVAADGVRVNSVCTGLFGTARLAHLFEARARECGTSVDEERERALRAIPVGRLGEPEELGDLVAFLASARCDFLTGAALPFDGGATRALL